ncbi:MAG: InlB B-repeat-containing protein [Clostridia bacterium]|nr:InlB B-repeat-containing protein [Clostridia bacterium]
MKLTRKILAFVICASLLLSASLPFAPVTSAYSPADGEFVFSSADMLSYITEKNCIDATFDSGAQAMKLTVSGNAYDPRALFDVSSLNLSASSFKTMVVIYRVPQSASYLATKTELFISAGSVTGPTAGKSVNYNVTKSESFVSQIIDLSSLSWWNGQVHSIRIDAFNSALVGDTLYIDSILFCSDYDTAIAKRDARIAERYNISTPEYATGDYVCTKYEYDKYTAPFWKGNIVYNEAVYPIMDTNGNAVYKLMYTPDEITSVYSADFSSKYYEGLDYVVNGDEITFLTSGSISLKEYTYIHPQSNPNGYSWDRYYNRTAAGDGKWEYWGQSPEFFNGYINVSYTHSDTWDHYVPEQRSGELPLTAGRISNKQAMNVVFFGDSICGGANSSSYRDVYPYAEYWNEMIVSKLRKDYGMRINATYSAEGGGAAPGLVSKTDEWVTAYNPDLVFIEFGVNDAMNWSQDSSGSASGLKSEFKSAIIDIIAEVRDTRPNCEFVLVAPFYANIHCHYMSYFDACRDALNEIAKTHDGVAVADVTAMHESLLEIKDYLDFSGDNMCHPNDYMARIYAQVCLETILPGGLDAYTIDTTTPPAEEEPDEGNTTYACPDGYGWQWPSAEAYGYIGHYGENGQDIIFTVDLALISSASEDAVAQFWTAEGGGVEISPTGVSLGDRTYAYDWGTADISNWHTVTITIKNGAAAAYIDGELIGQTQSGYKAYTSYQMFFSYAGCMAIDNLKLESSGGAVYVNCDFEDDAEAQELMGDGLGKRTLLAASTVSYDLNGGSGAVKNQVKVNGKDLLITSDKPTRDGYTFIGWATTSDAETAEYESGSVYSENSSVTLYAVWQEDSQISGPVISSITPTSSRITDVGTVAYKIFADGTELTYKWHSTNETLTRYMSDTDTAVLLITIDKLLSEELEAQLYCTVTDKNGNSVTSPSVSFTYVISPPPAINSTLPASALITDTGTAVFTVSATGLGLTYSWTCSDPTLLPYISGMDTATVTVDIANKLSLESTATLICTVTDKNGRTATGEAITLEYKLTPDAEPIIGDVTGDGKLNAQDVNALKRFVTGAAQIPDELRGAADINGDGALNALDANLLSRIISGAN